MIGVAQRVDPVASNRRNDQCALLEKSRRDNGTQMRLLWLAVKALAPVDVHSNDTTSHGSLVAA